MSLLDRYYTDEHNMFRDAVRKFYEKEVTPNADLWEKEGIVPRWVWKKAGEQGFLCPGFRRDGGVNADFLYSFIMTEEMAKTRCSGFFIPLHSDIIVPYINSYGTKEQKDRWLPGCVTGDIITAVAMTEPGTGSDLAAMRTTAVRDGDSFIINGQKTFISNGLSCDLVIVAAVTDPNARTPMRECLSSWSRTARRDSRRGESSIRSAFTRRTRPRWPSSTVACRPRTCWEERAGGSTTSWKSSSRRGSCAPWAPRWGRRRPSG